eukprot:364787-Chlamydomonas_euryale.AAC.23
MCEWQMDGFPHNTHCHRHRDSAAFNLILRQHDDRSPRSRGLRALPRTDQPSRCGAVHGAHRCRALDGLGKREREGKESGPHPDGAVRRRGRLGAAGLF